MRGYLFAAKILLLLGMGAAGFWAGYRWQGAEIVRLRAEQAVFKANADRIIAEEKARQAKVTEVVVTKYIKGAERIKTVTQEVVREIPVVVPAEYDANCPLPNGWVRLHDAACTGTAPGPASATDGTASGIIPSEALKYITNNYGSCHENAEKLKRLQEWVSLQYEGQKNSPPP
jgi:hypothetical protein